MGHRGYGCGGLLLFAWLVALSALLALVTGCVPGLRAEGPISPGASATPVDVPTPTAEAMPRLDPSPTPSDSTLPLTCQVTDLNVYVNEMDGFCFAYPTRFTLGDRPSDKPDVVGPPIGSAVEPVHATFAVDVTPAAPGQSLREQAEAFLADFTVVDLSTLTWSELQVGGEPAVQVTPVPVQLAWRLVFVQHGGRLYRLSYWPVDVPEAQGDLDDLTQTTLGSFAFTVR